MMEGFRMIRENFYEDLEMEGPVEERSLPMRHVPPYHSSRDKRFQEAPQV